MHFAETEDKPQDSPKQTTRTNVAVEEGRNNDCGVEENECILLPVVVLRGGKHTVEKMDVSRCTHESED